MIANVKEINNNNNNNNNNNESCIVRQKFLNSELKISPVVLAND